jgi:hypothetical protein
MGVDTDNSMHFLTSTLSSANPDCMDNSTPIEYGSGDLLDDFELEPIVRNRCNTWPMRHPIEFQTNDSPLMHEKIPEEDMYVLLLKTKKSAIFRLYSQNGSQVSVHLAPQHAYINNQINTNNYQQNQDSYEQGFNFE